MMFRDIAYGISKHLYSVSIVIPTNAKEINAEMKYNNCIHLSYIIDEKTSTVKPLI